MEMLRLKARIIRREFILRHIPVLLQCLGPYARRHLRIPIAVERFLNLPTLVLCQRLIIRHVGKSDGRPQEIDPFVGPVERSVAEMPELQSPFQGEVRCEPVRQMQSRSEIDEPSCADEFIVHIIVLVVLGVAVSRTGIDSKVGHPVFGAQERSCEESVECP